MTALNKQALRERYSPQPVPKCHICGAEMTVQRMSASSITYGCTGSTYDDTGSHYAEGRSIADDHYAQSRVTIFDVSDPEVLSLLDELEAAEKRIAELEVFISQSCYVFDGRDADISDSYIDASTSSLMPKVNTKNEGEPCHYCSDGSYSGLPGGACEHCMGTGLDNPTAGIDVLDEPYIDIQEVAQ